MMTLDDYLDLEFNGEVVHDVLLSEWFRLKSPRISFKIFCMNKFEEWENEQ